MMILIGLSMHRCVKIPIQQGFSSLECKLSQRATKYNGTQAESDQI